MKMPSLVLLLSFAFSAEACAQGTIYFINVNNPFVNAPVYQADHVTPLSGPQFMAELLSGSSADNLATTATTGFIPGGGGYFDGGIQAANGVGPGADAWVQVDVWNTACGSSFALAKASGLANSWWQSSVFIVHTGNPNPTPTPPGSLTGLGNSPVYLNSIPEPSTLALVGLGASLTLRKWLSRGPKAVRSV